MNDNQLDDLLNAPLTAVADNGFSARVTARARRERLKEQVPSLVAVLICAAAVLPFVPLRQITAAIAPLLTGMPASLAIAALVLTFTAERALTQR
jgi:hypothetical protein